MIRTVRGEDVLDVLGNLACGERNERAAGEAASRRAALTQQLDAAREALRRAQVGGCR
jgi:hypothetical protein